MVKQPKMADEPGADEPEKVRSDVRQERLEVALRENLKRRKQQTRARTSNKAASKSATPVKPVSHQTDHDEDL